MSIGPPAIELRDLTAILGTSTLRVSPTYEATVADRPRHAVGSGDGHAGSSVILVPAEGEALLPKAIDPAAAMLLDALVTPGPLPTIDAVDASVVAGLVLDRVLEIEHDGRFVSGPAAVGRFATLDGSDAADDPAPRLAHLSATALRQMASVGLRDAPSIIEFLYRYNSEPYGPRLPTMLRDRDVETYLGITGGAVASTLDRHWTRTPSPVEATAWLGWSPRHRRPAPTCKLYVSPAPAHTRDVFEVVVRIVADAAAPYLKIGADVFGLLRPDKLVVYFDTFDELAAAAREIEHATRGCDVQGVPFTGQLDDRGALSWARDPQPPPTIPWLGSQSWRQWLATRIAATVLAWHSAPADATLVEFVLVRLALDGVDPTHWEPTDREPVDVAR